MWGFILVPFLISTIWQDTGGVGKLFLSKDSGSECWFEHTNPSSSVCLLIWPTISTTIWFTQVPVPCLIPPTFLTSWTLWKNILQTWKALKPLCASSRFGNIFQSLFQRNSIWEEWTLMLSTRWVSFSFRGCTGTRIKWKSAESKSWTEFF